MRGKDDGRAMGRAHHRGQPKAPLVPGQIGQGNTGQAFVARRQAGQVESRLFGHRAIVRTNRIWSLGSVSRPQNPLTAENPIELRQVFLGISLAAFIED